jgi:hypothetical protein
MQGELGLSAELAQAMKVIEPPKRVEDFDL